MDYNKNTLLKNNEKTGHHYLAVCLLDALDEEDLTSVESLLKLNGANPNVLIIGREYACMHFAVGMENEIFAEKSTQLLLEYGGDPNVVTNEGLTPFHVAASAGRAEIVELLLSKGGDCNLLDNEQNSPINYAIYEKHFEVVRSIQLHLLQERKKKVQIIKTPRKILQDITSNSPEPNTPDNVKNQQLLTIGNKLYNFDKTSPFYVKITRRTKDSPLTQVNNMIYNNPKGYSNRRIARDSVGDVVNLFDLTENNLHEFTKHTSHIENGSRLSLIYSWRETVKRKVPRQRYSISDTTLRIEQVDHILRDSLLNDKWKYQSLSNMNTTGRDNSITLKAPQEKIFEYVNIDTLKTAKEDCINDVIVHKDNNDDDDNKAIGDGGENENRDIVQETINSTASFIKSPILKHQFIQEDYLHTDSENNIEFFERKCCYPHKENQMNNTLSSISTELDLPVDYDTDVIRQELTNYGEPPGPITSTTKPVYLKKLLRIKRNPERVKHSEKLQKKNLKSFSIELQKTMRDPKWTTDLPNYLELEKSMIDEFKTGNNKKWREGHFKRSFIYLLLDPRISDNLPINSRTMSKEDVWTRFISSIFYVGKGKSSRPYSHLYDAIKWYSQQNLTKLQDILKPREQKCNDLSEIDDVLKITKSRRQCENKLLTPFTNSNNLPSPKKRMADSEKLSKIIDIWSDHKGIVCLHVFHNIIPVEAYTREASIIDCLDKQNLTNEKRGNYYGGTTSWTMRQRKQLGVVLLYRALQIYLAEGESQIMPNDLI